MLLFNERGKLTDLNQSTLKLLGISSSNVPEIDLFDNSFFNFNKEKLMEEGMVNFQIQLNLGETGEGFELFDFLNLEGTVSVMDSGYLVLIQESPLRENSEELRISEERYRSFF